MLKLRFNSPLTPKVGILFNTKFWLLLLFFSPFGGWGGIFAQNARILSHPAEVQLERLNILNSTFKETNVCVSPDGKYLYFMTTRGGKRHSTIRKQAGKWEYEGDIWYSERVGNQWQSPKIVAGINTGDGEDEPNISPSGSMVIYQSWGFRNGIGQGWKEAGGPYFVSNLKNNKWGTPKGLGGGINAFFVEKEQQFFEHVQTLTNNPAQYQKALENNNYATDGATVSVDGRTFIVAVGEYSGNMDLYISRKNEKGTWGKMEKLALNTPQNERSPVLASDGKTLYFASDGMGGMGGMDIFKTTINPDNSHTEIVNVGEPFNSWEDDFGLILTANGDDGYFLREGDIYYAYTKPANKDLKPEPVTLMIAGKIIDQTTKEPLMAEIHFFDAEKNLIAKVSSNAIGEYSLILPKNTTFVSEKIEKENYQTLIGNISFPKIKQGFNRIDNNISLIPTNNPLTPKEGNEEKKESKKEELITKIEEKKETKKDEKKQNPPTKKPRPTDSAVQMGDILILK